MSRAIIFLLALLMSSHPITRAQVPLAPPDTITVGVRADAHPFSFRRADLSDRNVLDSYGGYIVEICRKVLSDMVVSGPFENFVVVDREVTASTRWSELNSGQVDMLCGPDSITLDRLEFYNASHPLFLSGITFVSTADRHFPRGRYCGPVIGLLKNTTAETEGLRAIDERGDLGLFDSALEAFLALSSDRPDAANTGELSLRFESFMESVIEGESAPRVDHKRSRSAGVASKDVKTDDCPNGFEAGPVVFYDSHQQGIGDLCAGKILYYIADVDILSRRLDKCDHSLHRKTLTREAYGVFFRRDTNPLATRAAEAGPMRDSLLYAEFNNVLLRKMQRTENILDYEFLQQFKEEEPTEDLRRFFDGYKFASDF